MLFLCFSSLPVLQYKELQLALELQVDLPAGLTCLVRFSVFSVGPSRFHVVSGIKISSQQTELSEAQTKAQHKFSSCPASLVQFWQPQTVNRQWMVDQKQWKHQNHAFLYPILPFLSIPTTSQRTGDSWAWSRQTQQGKGPTGYNITTAKNNKYKSCVEMEQKQNLGFEFPSSFPLDHFNSLCSWNKSTPRQNQCNRSKEWLKGDNLFQQKTSLG